MHQQKLSHKCQYLVDKVVESSTLAREEREWNWIH